MRFRWLAVVVLLGGVAMSASIEAQNKRTASLSVRVLVVRPCLVNTASAASGAEVNCEVPGAPAPRLNTTPFQGSLPGSSAMQAQPPALAASGSGLISTATPPPAALTTLSGGNTGGPEVADAATVTPDMATVITTNGDADLTPAAATPSASREVRQTDRLRVLTVNF